MVIKQMKLMKQVTNITKELPGNMLAYKLHAFHSTVLLSILLAYSNSDIRKSIVKYVLKGSTPFELVSFFLKKQT